MTTKQENGTGFLFVIMAAVFGLLVAGGLIVARINGGGTVTELAIRDWFVPLFGYGFLALVAVAVIAAGVAIGNRMERNAGKK